MVPLLSLNVKTAMGDPGLRQQPVRLRVSDSTLTMLSRNPSLYTKFSSKVATSGPSLVSVPVG